MATLPVPNYLTDAARTEGEAKVAFEDWLAATKQIPGAGAAEITLTIASGSITPPSGGPGIVSVDTEAAAASDDLANIVQTNIPNGSCIILRCANAGRVVTLKTSAGGAGQMVFAGSLDVVLNDVKKWVTLKRTGTLWEEISSPTFLAPTLVGGLVAAVPTVALGVANKSYVDARVAPAGLLSGCTMSNGTDAANDLNFAAGEVSSDDVLIANRVTMALAAITKQLDAAWVVGTNVGGRLSAAAIANTTYHIWVIYRPDTGVTDVGFDVSAGPPTFPSGYTKARRIGSIQRVGGALQQIIHDGDDFWLKDTQLDITAVNPGAAAVTRTLASVPTGVLLQAHVQLLVQNTAATGPVYARLSPLSATDETPSATNSDCGSVANVAARNTNDGNRLAILTNTSAQIRSRLSFSDGTTTLYLRTLGWRDLRGRT